MSESYGLLARYPDAGALVAAARRLRADGYAAVTAYSPYPVPGLAEEVGFRVSRMPMIALLWAALTGLLAFLLQWYSAAVDYPFVVGGKPVDGWPPFMLVTISVLLLNAVVATLVAMLVLNRLPRPYHPVFNVAAFARASDDGFFLLVDSRDGLFDAGRTAERLRELGAAEVAEVPP